MQAQAERSLQLHRISAPSEEEEPPVGLLTGDGDETGDGESGTTGATLADGALADGALADGASVKS